MPDVERTHPGRILRVAVYALDVTPEQDAALRSHAGAARFAYNTMLDAVGKNLDQRAAERSYGLDDDDLTPALGWSAYSLRNAFTAIKDDVAPWWREVSKEAFATGAANLAAALGNYRASKTGKRAGRPVGFPRFKSRDASTMSFTYTTGALTMGDDRHSIHLPRIGHVATFENTRAIHRRLCKGTARISQITVSYRRGRWQAAVLAHITTDHDPANTVHPNPGGVVGLDVGCTDWIVAATPEGDEVLRVPLPPSIAKAEADIRRLQRRGSRMQHGDWRTRIPKSNRARANERQVAKAHARVANIRASTLHQATSQLCKAFGVVAVEHLNVAGMMTRGGAHKRGLNRSIARASFATTASMCHYKSTRSGGEFVAVDRFYPSSKTCSACGVVKAKLTLAERVFACDECTTQIDRDLNAAINLARVGASTAVSDAVAGRGAWWKTETPRGGGILGVEASTPST